MVLASGLPPSVLVKVQLGVMALLPQSPTTSASAVRAPPFVVACAVKLISMMSLIGFRITPGKLNRRFVSPTWSIVMAFAPDETMLLDTYVTFVHPSPSNTRT